MVSYKFVWEGDGDDDWTDEEEGDIKKNSFKSGFLKAGSNIWSRVDNHLYI